ncbi:MAG: ATP-binding cassette domain-containing protein [SAR324 cluster bacterium]|nr:ATP-binding cassette domain-containing protein [SAR324 cluster bacterium]MBL7035403.1 ATP-binding cassette domain-containing protein [SAR324 cluster bacterium]
MIRVHSLSKNFNNIPAVDQVSFEVQRGEVLGFLGPNGAGKSTTMKMLTCFIPPSSGSAEICGFSILDDALQVRAQIGYLPESAPSYDEMLVGEFLRFVGEIRGFSGRELNRRVSIVLEMTALREVENQMIETLSKGFRQRTSLAQALIHDPPVLILDEPTDGLDPNQKHEVRSLIKNMSEDRTILISTHILEEVDAVCTRAMIISAGKVVGYGTPDELRSRSLYRNSVTVSVNADNHVPLMNDFNELDFVYSVEHLPEQQQGLVSMRLYPKNKESITRQLEQYLCTKKIPLEQFVVNKGRLDEVFRELTVTG